MIIWAQLRLAGTFWRGMDEALSGAVLDAAMARHGTATEKESR
jgi:hypothetical protein